jgi:hypothetical protein
MEDWEQFFKTRGFTFNKKSLWFSVVKIEDCLFSRRNGYTGKHILGYSVCLRIFKKTLI